MATPNITLRVPPEYRDLVRAMVARLKQDRNFAAVLQAALESAGQEPPPDLDDRLAALELRVHEQGQALAATAEALATMHASFKFSVNQRLTSLDERIGRFEAYAGLDDYQESPAPTPERNPWGAPHEDRDEVYEELPRR